MLEICSPSISSIGLKTPAAGWEWEGCVDHQFLKEMEVQSQVEVLPSQGALSKLQRF